MLLLLVVDHSKRVLKEIVLVLHEISEGVGLVHVSAYNSFFQLHVAVDLPDTEDWLANDRDVLEKNVVERFAFLLKETLFAKFFPQIEVLALVELFEELDFL